MIMAPCLPWLVWTTMIFAVVPSLSALSEGGGSDPPLCVDRDHCEAGTPSREESFTPVDIVHWNHHNHYGKPSSNGVTPPHPLNRSSFEDLYVLQGRPVVVRGVALGWPAIGKWTAAWFKAQFGDQVCCSVACMCLRTFQHGASALECGF